MIDSHVSADWAINLCLIGILLSFFSSYTYTHVYYSYILCAFVSVLFRFYYFSFLWYIFLFRFVRYFVGSDSACCVSSSVCFPWFIYRCFSRVYLIRNLEMCFSSARISITYSIHIYIHIWIAQNENGPFLKQIF